MLFAAPACSLRAFRMRLRRGQVCAGFSHACCGGDKFFAGFSHAFYGVDMISRASRMLFAAGTNFCEPFASFFAASGIFCGRFACFLRRGQVFAGFSHAFYGGDQFLQAFRMLFAAATSFFAGCSRSFCCAGMFCRLFAFFCGGDKFCRLFAGFRGVDMFFAGLCMVFASLSNFRNLFASPLQRWKWVRGLFARARHFLELLHAAFQAFCSVHMFLLFFASRCSGVSSTLQIIADHS
jgi:hypothetical protein